MMFPYPPFFTPRYRYPYPPKAFPEEKTRRQSVQNSTISLKEAESRKKENTRKEKKSTLSSSQEDFLLNIFGLTLHFDDILLLCLIFFLYQEGVKDTSLFLVLILLLMS